MGVLLAMVGAVALAASPRAELKKAQQAHGDADLESALRHLDAALASPDALASADRAAAHLLRGRVRFGLADTSEADTPRVFGAATDLGAAAALDPDLDGLGDISREVYADLLGRANARIQGGSVDTTARDWLAAAEPLDPNDPHTTRMLCVVAAQLDDGPLAVDRCDAVLTRAEELSGPSPMDLAVGEYAALLVNAHLYDTEPGDPEAALAATERASALHDRHRKALDADRELFSAADWARAEARHAEIGATVLTARRQALASHPTRWSEAVPLTEGLPPEEAYSVLLVTAQTAGAAGEEEAARPLLERAAALQPAKHQPWHHLGVMYVNLGVARSAELGADHADVRAALEVGRDALIKELELHPSEATVRNVRVVCEGLGDEACLARFPAP